MTLHADDLSWSLSLLPQSMKRNRHL